MECIAALRNKVCYIFIIDIGFIYLPISITWKQIYVNYNVCKKATLQCVYLLQMNASETCQYYNI